MASAAKYWGEESIDDAVYAVYLRKVRYVPPSRTDAIPQYRPIDSDTGDVDHLQWETVKERVIKCGSVERLLECLVTVDGVLDTRHFNVFFATYRAFTSNDDVLTKLIDRYERTSTNTVVNIDSSTTPNRPSKADLLDSLRSVLVCWLDLYREDFYEPSSDYALLTRLVDFGKRHQLKEVRSRARRLKDRFMRIHADGGPIAQLPSIDKHTTTFGFETLNDDSWTTKTIDICRENALQIAEQLTFWDAELFKTLLPHQCQGCVWSRRHKTNAEKVYTVRATINQFNAVSTRVMASIVVPECKSETRAKTIAKWIDVAKELRALKNFSSMKAVLSSLQSEPVHRLKSSWAHVPSRSLTVFRELSSLFEDEIDIDGRPRRTTIEEEGASSAKSSPFRRPQTNSCRRSKSDVNLSESPGTVPYLGNFLTDLAMIDEAHPDYTEDGLINFEKRRKEFEVLAKIRLFQSAARSYNIPMDRGFCTWFHLLPSLPENDCFARSLLIEKPPPNSLTPDQSKLSTGRHTSSTLSAGSSNGHLPKINSLSRLLTSMIGDEMSTHNGNHHHVDAEDAWLSVVPTSSSPSPPIHRNGHHHHMLQTEHQQLPSIMTRSVTAPSTPGGGTLSWRHGRSTFYEIGSEFNPSRMFGGGGGNGGQRSGSGTSSKKGSDSLSRSSTNTADLVMIVDTPHSRSITPQHFESPLRKSSNGIDNKSTPITTKPTIKCSSTGSSQSSSSAVSSTSSSSITTTNYSGTNTNNNGVGTITSSTMLTNNNINYHIARVGLDDGLQGECGGIANYKCIKVENGDRMSTLIDRILEKHLIEGADRNDFCLVQLLPDGGEFQLPDKCNPFYAVAPDSSSSMLNFILRRRPTSTQTTNDHQSNTATTTTKKQNRIKRSNLLRWSSGYL